MHRQPNCINFALHFERTQRHAALPAQAAGRLVSVANLRAQLRQPRLGAGRADVFEVQRQRRHLKRDRLGQRIILKSQRAATHLHLVQGHGPRFGRYGRGLFGSSGGRLGNRRLEPSVHHPAPLRIARHRGFGLSHTELAHRQGLRGQGQLHLGQRELLHTGQAGLALRQGHVIHGDLAGLHLQRVW